VTPSLVSGLVAIVALAACGSVDGASPAGTATSPTSPDQACAVTGPLSSAFGVGPTVTFVTRGPGAQQACDAEVDDPRSQGPGLKPAYLPSGSPVCTYVDSHDPPPEGGRTYEVYGSGASTLCDSIGPHRSPGATSPPP
jgi:hypothetical protein